MQTKEGGESRPRKPRFDSRLPPNQHGPRTFNTENLGPRTFPTPKSVRRHLGQIIHSRNFPDNLPPTVGQGSCIPSEVRSPGRYRSGGTTHTVDKANLFLEVRIKAALPRPAQGPTWEGSTPPFRCRSSRHSACCTQKLPGNRPAALV